mmetsp:Transcript_27497/g.49769  ORF Transcript_27497/g.49769 Transcript_27497/m.49769 type:complete len:98 (+) Transcript_27497:372-665(+)
MALPSDGCDVSWNQNCGSHGIQATATAGPEPVADKDTAAKEVAMIPLAPIANAVAVSGRFSQSVMEPKSHDKLPSELRLAISTKKSSLQDLDHLSVS